MPESEYSTGFKDDERSKHQIDHEKTLSEPGDHYDPGFHSENLYDQNEGAGGERIDLRTGKPIDNSTFTDLHELGGGYIEEKGFAEDTEDDTEGGEAEPDHGLTPELEDDDEATQWLAENDPEQDQQAA